MNRNYNNFDFIRFVAALLVIITHSYPIKGLDQDDDLLGKLTLHTAEFSYLAVCVFFIISGFLVCQSLLNTKSYKDYFIKRCLRIFPGLIVVVLLSVFILGPLTTSLSLSEYFTSKTTYFYLLNIFLYPLRFFLPGVFEKNPFGGAINGSIWTLKYEFTFYIGLAVLLFLKLLNKISFSIILLALIIFRLFFYEQQKLFEIPYLDLNIKFMVDFGIYFFTGTFFFLFRADIKDKINFYTLALVTALWVLSFGTIFASLANYIFFPVLTFFAAFLPGKLNHFGKRGDFSYGIYIYAFPIQQLIVYITKNTISLTGLILLSAGVTLVLAIASWHLVEKKALNLKRLLR
jgi:peptidoglycan/LPS O-acetylase OafA/YrhL